MGARDAAKIEDYEVMCGSARVIVEIFVAKSRLYKSGTVEIGSFYAQFADDAVSDRTLEGVRKKIDKLVSARRTIEFKPYIVLKNVKSATNRRMTVDDKEDDRTRTVSHENGFRVHGAGCSFSYMRIDLAEVESGKRGQKKRLGRLYVDDFEARVAELRDRIHGYDKNEIRKAADEVEARARAARAEFRDVREPYFGSNERVIPYSEDVWVGLRCIADALRATQDKLDAILRHELVSMLLIVASCVTPLALPKANDLPETGE